MIEAFLVMCIVLTFIGIIGLLALGMLIVLPFVILCWFVVKLLEFMGV